MAQTIKLKRSGTQNAVPTTSQLALGEVALNTYDGKMYIKKSVGGTESIVEIGGDATSSSGLDFTGNLNLEDNVRIVIGDGNDLQIYHDGSNSFINDSGTGNLTIRATNLALQSAAAENYLFAAADGSVTVYHDNSAKLATTSSGVSVTGNISGSGGLGVSGNITVGSSSSAVISLERASSNYILANNSGTGRLYIGAGSELVFLTGQSDGDYTQNEKIRIDSSGRLLVNTTSSVDNFAKIQVVGDSSSLARITLKDVDGTNQYTYFEQSGGGTRINTQNGTSNGFFTIGAWNGTASSDFVRVDSSGRVGIGTTAPSEKLHVDGNIRLQGTNSLVLNTNGSLRYSSSAGAVLLSNGSSEDVKIRTANNANAGDIILETDESERLRILGSNGNVGIGTTSPDFTLDVTGSAGAYSAGDNIIGVFQSGTDHATYLKVKNINTNTTAGATRAGIDLDVANHADSARARAQFVLRSITGADVGGDTNISVPRDLRFLINNESTLTASSGEQASSAVVAGTEIMRIASTGNVGIGNTSPGEKLEVTGTIKQAGTYNLTLSGGANITGSNHVYIKANSSYVRIDAPNNSIYYNAGTDHVFGNGNGSTEYMRIDTNGTNAGNVGIGTTSPDAKLVVSSGGTTAAHSDTDLLVRHSSAASTTAQVQILSGNTGASNLYFSDTDAYSVGGFQYNHSSNYLAVRVNAAERMRIDSSGNLLVGKTSTSIGVSGLLIEADGKLRPSMTSDVAADFNRLSTDGAIIGFRKDGTTVGSIQTNSGRLDIQGASNTVRVQSGTSLMQVTNGTQISFETAGSERLRIADNGNVGIGTTSPSTKLDVVGSGRFKLAGSDSSAHRVLVESAGDADYGVYIWSAFSATMGRIGALSTSDGGTDAASINFENYGQDLAFRTGRDASNAERARIDSTGNFLVGKTSSALNTAGAEIATSGRTRFTRDSANVVEINRTTDAGSIVTFNVDGSMVGNIGSNAARLFIHNNYGNGSGFRFDNGSINPASSSGANEDNTTDLGTSSVRFKDLHLSGQVNTGTISSGNITTTGYLRGPSTFTIDPATHGDDTGTVVIAGNLQVDGTTTTINSTTLTVDDKNITLASGSTNKAAANGAGLTVDCGSDTDATLTYHATGDRWELNKPLRWTYATATTALALNNNNIIEVNNIAFSDPGANEGLSWSGGNMALFESPNDLSNASGNLQVTYGGTRRFTVDNTGIDVNGNITLSGNVVDSDQNEIIDIDINDIRFNGKHVQSAYGVWIRGENNSSNNRKAGIDGNSSGTTLQFYVENAERARLNNSGNLGIGTTSPIAKLDVAGDGKFRGTADGAPVLKLGQHDNSATTPLVTVYTDDGGSTRTFGGDSLEFNFSRYGQQIGATRGSAAGGNVRSWKFGTTTNGDERGIDLFIYSQGDSSATGSTGTSTNVQISATSNRNSYINTSGNFGLGTNAPTHKLHVASTSPSLLLQKSDETGRQTNISHSSGLTKIRSRNNSTNGQITFEGYTSSTTTEYARFDASGNLGIGTTSPSTQLHVSSTSTSTLTVQNTTNAGNASLHFRDENNADQYKVLYDLPNNRAEQHFNGNGLRFYSNQISAEVAKIGFGNNYNTSYFAGRVGIGTSSPTHNLHIQNSGTAAAIKLRRDDSAKEMLILIGSGYGYVQNTTGPLGLGGSNDDRDILIDTSGRVGIGTTSPGTKLHIADSATPVLRISHTAGTAQNVDIYNSGGTMYLRARNDTANGPIIFQGGGGGTNTEYARFQSTGYLGVGTTGPSRRLHVKDSNYSVARLERDGAGGGVALEFKNGDGNIWQVSNDGDEVLRFYYASNNRFQVTSTGAATFNNAFTFPTSDGQANQVLKTDGSGNVTWATEAATSANTSISDADGDTKIQVEESSDEDIIRFDTAGAQRMLIDAAGNVGINSSSLTKTLNVGGTFLATGEAFFSHFDNTTSSSRMRDNLRLNFGTSRTFAITGNSTNMHIKNSTTDVMTFDTSNRVGIGTTSPGNKLQVNVATDDRIVLNQTAGQNFGLQFQYAGTRTWDIYNNGAASSKLFFYSEVLGDSAMTITTAGKVGIGTNTPSTNLHIQTANDNIALFESTDNKSYITIKDNDTTVYVSAENSRGSFGFQAGTHVNNLNIDTSGNVGLNTSSPLAKLDVRGATLFSAGDEGSRHGTEFNWVKSNTGSSGNGVWYKVADISLPSASYSAMSFEAYYETGLNNFGSHNYLDVREVFVSIVRNSTATANDSPDSATLRGRTSDIRVYKTAAGTYELQARHNSQNAKYAVRVRVFQTNGGTITPKMDGSTAGTTSGGTEYTVSEPATTEGVRRYLADIDSSRIHLGNVDLYPSGNLSYIHVSGSGILPPSTTASSNGSLGTSTYLWNGVFSRRFQGEIGTAGVPTFTFSEDSNTGMYDEWYVQADSKRQLSFSVDGVRRMHVNEAGIWSAGNFYLPSTGASLRSFHTYTEISNGTSGNGFRMRNSADGVDSLIVTSAGNGTFAGSLTVNDEANIGHATIDTNSTTTSATTQVAIDTFAAATFRSAEFTIQVTNSTDSTYHITKVLLIHDGTTPGITEYGTVFTGSAAEATFDADISSGNVRLLATPASTDSMTFKVVRHCITV